MKSPKILVVEDESVIALDISYTLKSLGYKVSGVVSSGEESIQEVSKVLPDLVLMDIKLKGELNGLEAAKKIYECFRIPIVYLTAYRDKKTIKRMEKYKYFGYVEKPFGEKKLKNTIEETLTNYYRCIN